MDDPKADCPPSEDVDPKVGCCVEEPKADCPPKADVDPKVGWLPKVEVEDPNADCVVVAVEPKADGCDVPNADPPPPPNADGFPKALDPNADWPPAVPKAEEPKDPVEVPRKGANCLLLCDPPNADVELDFSFSKCCIASRGRPRIASICEFASFNRFSCSCTCEKGT